jgi:hypothetical protein
MRFIPSRLVLPQYVGTPDDPELACMKSKLEISPFKQRSGRENLLMNDSLSRLLIYMLLERRYIQVPSNSNMLGCFGDSDR